MEDEEEIRAFIKWEQEHGPSGNYSYAVGEWVANAVAEVDILREGIAKAARALAADGHDQDDTSGERCLTCGTYYDLLGLIGQQSATAERTDSR